jgi:hypothetical protein
MLFRSFRKSAGQFLRKPKEEADVKRMFLFVVVMIVLSAPFVASLDIYLGPKSGPNLGYRWGEGYEASHDVSLPKINAHVRGSFGCFAEFGLLPILAVQVEGYYTIDGSLAKGMIGGVDTWESFDQNYIESVVLAKLRLGRKRTRFVIVAGPDIRYGVGRWHHKVRPHPVLGPPDELIEYYYADDREAEGMSSWIYGGVAGIGVEIDLGPGYLSQGLRTYLGFTDYYEDGPEFRPGSIMYMIGYGFKVK